MAQALLRGFAGTRIRSWVVSDLSPWRSRLFLRRTPGGHNPAGPGLVGFIGDAWRYAAAFD